MEVKRVISVYDKVKDNLIEEIEIDIPVDVLREILNVESDDFNVFKIYPITDAQLRKFIEMVPKLSKWSSDKVDLFYECFQS
jgi:hypothetical protein